MTKGFASLETRMERGFASVADDIADLRTELKGDIAPVGEQLTSIEAELRRINHRLDVLEEQVSGLKGFSKEIGDLRARVPQIEKHLGINKKIAA
jgi:predicted nuclease with TOPRIM domain